MAIVVNCSLYEVLNQDILNDNCVERPVDYLQKVMEALGSFTREKSCQNVAFLRWPIRDMHLP
jgi:hypothetical protein